MQIFLKSRAAVINLLRVCTDFELGCAEGGAGLGCAEGGAGLGCTEGGAGLGRTEGGAGLGCAEGVAGMVVWVLIFI